VERAATVHRHRVRIGAKIEQQANGIQPVRLRKLDQQARLAAQARVLGQETFRLTRVAPHDRHSKTILHGKIRTGRAVGHQEIENVAVTAQHGVRDIGPMGIAIIAAQCVGAVLEKQPHAIDEPGSYGLRQQEVQCRLFRGIIGIHRRVGRQTVRQQEL
jgi:hypothetical protein